MTQDMGVRFDGEIVIVTGAASGNGRAIAAAAASAGATVIGVDRTPTIATVMAEIANDSSARAIGIAGDVAEESVWAEARRLLVELGAGRLSLINNAGVYRRGGVEEISLDDVDLLYRVNQRAILVSVAALTPELTARGGAIVNVSSTAGITGEPLISAYSGTKWAVRGISRSLAAELGPRGVRVNTLIPGLFDTAMAAANGGDVNDAIIARTFLGRIGQPAEIAPAALFLASTAASYVTGAELVVDAGLSV